MSTGWVLGRVFSGGISVRFAMLFLSASVLALIWHAERYQYVVTSMQARVYLLLKTSGKFSTAS